MPGLGVLLDEVDEVTTGVHRADDVGLPLRRLGDVGREVVVGERRRDLLADGTTRLGHRRVERLGHVLAEGVVGVDDVPGLAALLGHRGAGALGEHVGVVRPVEGVLVALVVGQGRGAGADVDEQLLLRLGLGGHRERGRRGRHVEDDVGLLPVVELLGLGVGDVGLVLVVGADDLDVRRDGLVAVLGLEVGDGHLDRLDAVGTRQVLVDARLVVEDGEDDLVVGDLAAAGAGAAATAPGEEQARSGRDRDRGDEFPVAHVSPPGVLVPCPAVVWGWSPARCRGTRAARRGGRGTRRCRATRRPGPGRAGCGGRPRWRRR